MKRRFITGLVAFMAISTVAYADPQISGNVTTNVGYQHDNKNATVTDGTTVGGLTQGDTGFTSGANVDHFGFWVDQAEVDVENQFSDLVSARLDADFMDLAGGAGSAVSLEQAYVTTGLGATEGLQLLVGKFNAPIGIESVDRHNNVFSTYTPGYDKLMPTQVIGAKFYYEFNDNWNMDLAAVNNLNNASSNDNNSAYPSGLLRVGGAWGEEGNQSYINAAFAFGPEHTTTVTGAEHNSHFDFLADLWGNWALGDAWNVGWEGTWRMTQAYTTGQDDQQAFAGQLYAKYMVSDAWTVQLRGAMLVDTDADLGNGASRTGGTWGGFEGSTYSGTLGATYTITDGAAVKWEYRFDYADPSTSGLDAAQYHTAAVEFGYSF